MMHMHDTPTISVLVTTRNQHATIARALDSILRQRCEARVEIVIGDDASTDGTAGICRRYRDAHPERVRLLAHPERQGIMRNYYACMDAAAGEYIADLAGDDEWADDRKLQRELAALSGDPTLALVHTDYAERDAATGSVTPVAFPYTEGPTGDDALAEEVLAQGARPVVHLCTALYRREAAMRCRERWPQFFTGEWPCEDLQLATLIGYEGRVLHLPAQTLYYTVGHTSASQGSDDRRQYAFKRACLGLSVALRDHLSATRPAFPSPTGHLGRALSEHIHALLMHAVRLADGSLRRDALSLSQQWGIPLSPLSRLVAAATATEAGWRATLFARRLFVWAKAHGGF